MSDRIKQPFTNEHFAAFCEQMVGQPYWYGTCCYKATESLRSRKAEQYPSHYSSARTARYRQDIASNAVVADCIGGVKGYAWTNGGDPILALIGKEGAVPNSYGSNGCPDKGANGMFTYAKGKGCAWGAIDTLPEVVGLALHKDGHIGYYMGNGYAVEWQGFSAGCVRTKVANRSWQYWYKLPFLDYGDGVITGNTPTIDVAVGTRLLEKGASGADVKAMQEMLIQIGYGLPHYGADGKFGSETLSALLAFQRDEGLEDDGKYGEKTHAALLDAVADDDEDGTTTDAGAGQTDASAQKPAEEDEKKASSTKVVIISEGGKVNIRVGNGTEFSRISSVAPGTTFNHVATAANGWHAIVVGSRVGWVSGNYARII